MRFTVENDYFKKYSLEASTAEVFEKLSNTGRLFVKDLSDEEEISKLMEHIASLLALKASRKDRRKSYLVLKKPTLKRRLSMTKSTESYQGRAKRRIISSNSESDWANTTGEDIYEVMEDVTIDHDDAKHPGKISGNLESLESSDQHQEDGIKSWLHDQELAQEASPEEIEKIYNSIVELDLTFEYAATEIQKIARGFMVRNNFDLISDNIYLVVRILRHLCSQVPFHQDQQADLLQPFR